MARFSRSATVLSCVASTNRATSRGRRGTASAVGFVLDPDADRLSLIDEDGTCISEEATLALAVKWRLREENGPVVINMSTSRMVEDIAHAAGSPCYRSAVGEANVVARMR